MSPQLPEVDIDECLKAANKYCRYYAGIRAEYEWRRLDPNWLAMQRVAETWREILMSDTPTEAQIIDLETRIQVVEEWAESGGGGTAWDCMASEIDIWLQSKRRTGIGENA